MMEKILTLLVGLLIALGGWSLSRTFELSTHQAVQMDKVDKLERQVEKMQNKTISNTKKMKMCKIHWFFVFKLKSDDFEENWITPREEVTGRISST